MLGSVELRDYMQPLPETATVRADESVFRAIERIIDKKVSGVLVVDDEKNLVGILSEIDCLRSVLSSTYNKSGSATVKEYMTPLSALVTADINDDIVDVASDMLKKNHRRRPVLENGKIVGQITCRRILMAMRNFSDDKLAG